MRTWKKISKRCWCWNSKRKWKCLFKKFPDADEFKSFDRNHETPCTWWNYYILAIRITIYNLYELWEFVKAIVVTTNTKSLAKEFSEILIFAIWVFWILGDRFRRIFWRWFRITPHNVGWKSKMRPWGVMGEKLIFRWSRDQCSAKREKGFISRSG